MPYDFHALNERIARLPLPERSMAQFIADTYRAQSCFEDHERTLVALASKTDDPQQRANMTQLAAFARQLSTSAVTTRSDLRDETCGSAIIEGEYTEVDAEAPTGDCPRSSEEAAQ